MHTSRQTDRHTHTHTHTQAVKTRDCTQSDDVSRLTTWWSYRTE